MAANKKIIKTIKKIELSFEKKFKNRIIISTKKIYKQPVMIEIIDQNIFISFVEKENSNQIREFELSYGYIDPICSCIRNLVFITGNFNNFIKSNLDDDVDKIIKNQILLNEIEYQGLPESNIDSNLFFAKFTSTYKPDYYKYINNSIPWFLLLERKRVLSEKFRIIFTLIEMIVCCEHQELRKKGQTEKRYKTFIDEAKIKANTIKKLRELFNSLLCKNNKDSDSEYFTITKFTKIVNDVFAKNSNQQSQIYLILFHYRNHLLHGSMNPIIKLSSKEYLVLEKFSTIIREYIYIYVCRLIKKIK